MSKASERLRELALHMMVKDLDMQLPSGCINPEEAADLLDEAEKALAACLAGDPGWLINVRITLARIRGEK